MCTDIFKNDNNEIIEDDEKESCKDNYITEGKEFTDAVKTFSCADSHSCGDKSDKNMEKVCPEDTKTNDDKWVNELRENAKSD